MDLQSEINYKLKRRNDKRYYGYQLPCLFTFNKLLIPKPIDDCKLFLCNSETTHALLASKRHLIDLPKMPF